jgi:hypothetical protein
MYISKRKNGFYFIEYVDPATNKIRRRTTKSKKKQEAIRFLSEFEKELSFSNKKPEKCLSEFGTEYSNFVRDTFLKKYLSSVQLSFRKMLAHIGDLMGSLPLNYNNAVMKTIENIDVIWLKGNSIIRAFEVEHTTSIYSGILRMADLLALLPNIDIKLHIVAPTTRREKVFEEIQRPIFSIIEGKALRDLCTFISYDKVKELSEEKHLGKLKESVVDDFAEVAE